MKTIPLSQGLFAMVDDDMFDKLNQFTWCATCEHGSWYALTGNGVTTPRWKMHEMVIGVAPKGFEVGHMDTNGLNNQRDNLRFVSHAQNLQNRGKTKANTSEYKGVFIKKENGTIYAQIKVDNILYKLGYYDTLEEAAYAYDVAASILSEYVKTNGIRLALAETE